MYSGSGGLLIVDDEPVVLTSLSALFRRRGYDVLAASSGAAAMTILRRQPVDGMLIDFRLPDMRGNVLFAAAVAIQGHLRARTIFITGDVTVAVTEALADIHCPIVLKPFDLPELERMVSTTIGAAAMRPARDGP